jgi:hypothetical protein
MIDWIPNSYPGQPNMCAFGDFISVKPSDAYNCLLVGFNTTALSNPYTGNDFYSTQSNTATGGHIITRSYAQIGTQIAFYKWAASPNLQMGYGTTVPFPCGADSGIHFSPAYIYEKTNSAYRGYFAGLYVPFESLGGAIAALSVAVKETTVVISGHTYIAYRITGGAQSYYGYVFFDLTGPWS